MSLSVMWNNIDAYRLKASTILYLIYLDDKSIKVYLKFRIIIVCDLSYVLIYYIIQIKRISLFENIVLKRYFIEKKL